MRWRLRKNRRCKLYGHNWFALSYPPGPRRRECLRCGRTVEEKP